MPRLPDPIPGSEPYYSESELRAALDTWTVTHDTLADRLADLIVTRHRNLGATTRPPALREAMFTIPGSIAVTVRGAADDPTTGEVIRLAFTPDDLDPTADLLHVEDLDRDDAEGYAETQHDWQPSDSDGPFWTALRLALADETRFANMDDNDDDRVVVGPAVPIQWTE